MFQQFGSAGAGKSVALAPNMQALDVDRPGEQRSERLSARDAPRDHDCETQGRKLPARRKGGYQSCGHGALAEANHADRRVLFEERAEQLERSVPTFVGGVVLVGAPPRAVR